ncbi:serine/threonine-protein kinase [uncultured Pontibacter sp.]|uniref:serine/threonine protein kinase n=1 Tax=uncultured Pontibacter sp. TaxID=453356 RepID=UPI0026241AE8|nr:serine/threonine-protein kinase [uncultured Pontibacter sp.]
MTTDLLIPSYNILRVIGEGGMATVYLGEHARLGNKVAIKVLNSHYARHEQVRGRFLTEAKVLASFLHPHIVGVKDFFEEGDVLAFVMDYVEGLPLDEYLYTHNALRDPAKAIAFFSQILDAFSYAHQNGIVHRDIKPGNLMVTQDGQVRVLDFGIAKLLETPVGAAKATATGTMLGTPMYMSPEQINLKPGESIDHRSDIYALGVTLHQILSGRPPYDADTHSGFEMQMKIMTEPLPRLEQVPEWLQQVVDKATAKKREDRFQNCSEFLQALKIETGNFNVTGSKQDEQPVFKTVYNEAAKVEAKTVVSTPRQQKTQIAAAPQVTQILEKPQTTQFIPPAQATKVVESKPDQQIEEESSPLSEKILLGVLALFGVAWLLLQFVADLRAESLNEIYNLYGGLPNYVLNVYLSNIYPFDSPAVYYSTEIIFLTGIIFTLAYSAIPFVSNEPDENKYWEALKLFGALHFFGGPLISGVILILKILI